LFGVITNISSIVHIILVDKIANNLQIPIGCDL
jgi:hypothetical protein